MENPEKDHQGDCVEFVKGCPICERTDPQLERELHALAQLLFDIWLDKHHSEETGGENSGIDNQC